ncbi:hypothetical protein D9O50_11765 [Oxalobacteraceae bacterium CAVE-383]|nr:hypothetical protein D9O50_11765 [Oxalobacteraceae bacterium CAVE-383]
MTLFKNLPTWLNRAAYYLFFGIVGLLTLKAYEQYSGHGYIYLLFTVISNSLLYLGFRKKAIFFDAAIGVFFWLGFWLKTTIRIAFLNGVFHEAVGNFDGSGAAFDRGLLVSSCGLLALVVVAVIRGHFFSYAGKRGQISTQPGLFKLYQSNRKYILATFVLLCAGVAISNVYLGIYQRGEVSSMILPFGLSGIYKWLLLFGLASFGAIILQFEYVICKRNSYLVAILVLLEGLLSNVSMLSRGMVLNSVATFFGLFKSLQCNLIAVKFRFFATIAVIFLTLFLSSLLIVSYLRYYGPVKFDEKVAAISSISDVQHVASSGFISSQTDALFIDRWVGVEGVFAVSSSKKEGWDLWRNAWRETYAERGTSFYDLNLIQSPYLITDLSKHHYISLPGVIAFFFYPGSFPFLFFCMLLVGAIGALTEIVVYKMSGKNLILCSLLAQVVAFRFASFGYAPSQSYLLFGSLILNLVFIYGAERLLSRSSGFLSPALQNNQK